MLKSLISIDDLSEAQINQLLKKAQQFELNHHSDQLKGKVVASLFFEPSTRTRLSFESAISYLGGSVIGFASADTSSQSKGESLEDTIRAISQYADAIVIRHGEAGSASRAQAVSGVPIVNAGDGSNEHPTQTLLDLYSIQSTQGGLEGLNIALAGDLKYGRTVHSLVKALTRYRINFTLIADDYLQLPQDLVKLAQDSGCQVQFRSSIGQLDKQDILYMTRVQKERFDDPAKYFEVAGRLKLSLEDLVDTKETFRVLHPLPRVDEIDLAVDKHPAAYYFEQVRNGLYVRQALLYTILNG
ncbi:aspartate carbamoyltransferase [Candidatus Saccharibacteria bacterium]|nr:aspartate carbamoyltransferase [Candidatus Saccharibacteria bacterium]MCB9834928.1 aspartate carbamoyltransferase [Candidatus Nomurabacteria bacterium]